MSKLSVLGSAFDIFSNARDMIVFYMFIIEEAIQSQTMTIYNQYRSGMHDQCEATCYYVLTDLINPLKEFANSPAGQLAYPMNVAFSLFCESSEKSVLTYIDLIRLEAAGA